MTTFFEHQRTSYKRNYLKTLIHLASSDGQLDESEKTLIQKIGLKRGLKSWQIDALLKDETVNEIFIPESVTNKMNLLYDVMQIIYADGFVSEKEIDFITGIVAAFKLNPSLVAQLLSLFDGHTPSSQEWADFLDEVLRSDIVETPAPTIL